jgi:hypothetical protein
MGKVFQLLLKMLYNYAINKPHNENLNMPEISRFFGILIKMYYNEHNPPHFHAKYGDHEAAICIKTLEVIEGKIPPRVFGLVMEWASIHQDELLENWNLMREEKYNKIDPLV